MKTVLVADDEFDLLDTIRSILEQDGYQVVACADGVEALEVLRSRRPDLALLDVMMPRLGGLEVLHRMKQDPALDGIPVVIMSAVTPRVVPHEFKWDAFLKKPFTLSALSEAVRARIGEAA